MKRKKERKKQKCQSSALPLFKGQWRYHRWQAADMINCNLTLFLFCPTTTIEPGQSSGGSGGQINGSAASLLSGGKEERIDPPPHSQREPHHLWALLIGRHKLTYARATRANDYQRKTRRSTFAQPLPRSSLRDATRKRSTAAYTELRSAASLCEQPFQVLGVWDTAV